MKEVTIGSGIDPILATSMPTENSLVASLIEVSIGIGFPIISVGKGWEVF